MKIIKEVFKIDNDSLFGETVHIVFTNDLNRTITDQCNMHNIPVGNKLCSRHASACVLFIREDDYYSNWCLFDVGFVDPGIILHECCHISFNFLSSRGIEHVEQTDEVYAYTTQWLFNKVSGFYNSLPNKIKRMSK